MRITIIGGTNFIGPRVVREIAADGHDVTVVHRRLHEAELPAAVRHVHCDASANLPESLEADVVVHMTAMGERDARFAVEHFRHGRAGRLVLISSGDVYLAYGRLQRIEPGPPVGVPIDEDAPLRRVLYPYRATAVDERDMRFWYEKILAERVASSAPELPCTILRLPKVHDGTFRHLEPFRAHATWRWTHGHVDDIAHAIALATLNDVAAGRTYNVGEAVTPTVAERLGSASGFAEGDGEYDFSQDLVLDTSRIRRELGYDRP